MVPAAREVVEHRPWHPLDEHFLLLGELNDLVDPLVVPDAFGDQEPMRLAPPRAERRREALAGRARPWSPRRRAGTAGARAGRRSGAAWTSLGGSRPIAARRAAAGGLTPALLPVVAAVTPLVVSLAVPLVTRTSRSSLQLCLQALLPAW
jgi:hypothetical protein